MQWGLSTCISNKFPDAAAGPETTPLRTTGPGHQPIPDALPSSLPNLTKLMSLNWVLTDFLVIYFRDKCAPICKRQELVNISVNQSEYLLPPAFWPFLWNQPIFQQNGLEVKIKAINFAMKSSSGKYRDEKMEKIICEFLSMLSLSQVKRVADKNSNLTKVHSHTRARDWQGGPFVSGSVLASPQSDTPPGVARCSSKAGGITLVMTKWLQYSHFRGLLHWKPRVKTYIF